MANNVDITIYDFEGICRTCLSREDLKPLYEKGIPSTYLVDMLMSCTVVKFVEDDGLPVKICTNCINEINQAFSFAKRCETTDTILRNCVKNIITELVNNSSQSRKVGPIIEVEKEIKPEFFLPNMPTGEEVLKDFKFMEEVKHEEVNIEIKSEIILMDYESVEEDSKMTIECEEFVEKQKEDDETIDDLPDESYKEDSKKSDNPGYALRPRSTNSQIKKKSSEDEDDTPLLIRLDLLNTHQMVHTEKEKDEKSNVCSVCNKAFAHSTSLKNHMRSHIGEKQKNCKVCSKAFTQAHNLKNHMKIHTLEKSCICEVCSKSFTGSETLKEHMRIHTEVKPYTCKVCSKAFTLRSNLTCHMIVHTGEKPYICKICSKAFALGWYLRRHMITHTAKKPYDVRFVRKRYLFPYKQTRTEGI